MPIGVAQSVNQEVVTKQQLKANNSNSFNIGLEIADEAAGLLKQTRHPIFLMLAIKRLLPKHLGDDLRDGFITRAFEIAPEWGSQTTK